MIKLKKYIYVIAMLVSLMVFTYESSSKEIKFNINDYFNGIQSIEAIFKQTIFSSENDVIDYSEGLFLLKKPDKIMVDGFSLDISIPNEGIIKGDQKSLSIATASIIAKVHRDRYMQFLSYTFPYYHWSSNAGYGTKKHIEQICKKGITIHHRKSFEPIKSLIHSK